MLGDSTTHKLAIEDPYRPKPPSVRQSADRPITLLSSLALLLVAVLTIEPVLLYSYFPSQDAPAHFDSANVIRLSQTQENAFVAQFVTVEAATLTNQLSTYIFLALGSDIPGNLAVKLVYILFFLSMFASFAVTLYLFGDRAILPLMLAAPFAFSRFVHYGFFNNMFGFAIAIAALALFFRYYESRRLHHLLLASALTIASFFAHVFTTAAILLIAGVFFFIDWLKAVLEPRMLGERSFGEMTLKRLIGPALACLPAALLVLGFMLSGSGGEVETQYDLRRKILQLATLGLMNFGLLNVALSVALAGVIGLSITAMLAQRLERGLPRDKVVFMAALAVLTGVYFIIPDWFGSVTLFDLRFTPFIALVALFFLMVAPPVRAVRPMMVAALTVNIALFMDRTLNFQRLNNEYREVEWVASTLAPRSSLAHIDFSMISRTSDGGALASLTQRQQRFDPHLHNAGYIANGRDILNVSNYQMNPALLYFRARLRCQDPCPYTEPDLIAPLALEGDLEGFRAALAGLEQVISAPLDTIVIRHAGLEGENRAAYDAAVAAVLAPRYDRLVQEGAADNETTPESAYHVYVLKPDAPDF